MLMTLKSHQVSEYDDRLHKFAWLETWQARNSVGGTQQNGHDFPAGKTLIAAVLQVLFR